MAKKGINRYRPDRREELLEKARKAQKELKKRQLIEKRLKYKIRDDPLDDRI